MEQEVVEEDNQTVGEENNLSLPDQNEPVEIQESTTKESDLWSALMMSGGLLVLLGMCGFIYTSRRFRSQQ